MNLIFLTISRIDTISNRGIYADLMRKFKNEGHSVYIVTPYERKFGKETTLKKTDGVNILGVKTFNIQKTNIIEKGLGTVLIENQFKAAIKKYFSNINFDLIIYSTPPITFTNVVKYLKKKNPNAISYLLLKDIFPQNAVDIEMFSKNSLFYKYFRKKEVNLYKCSDYIGCMSPANVDFVLSNNNFIDSSKVEVAPNSIEIIESNSTIERNAIRNKYNLPLDKPIFIYGGNLGKPQGIDFLIECLKANNNRVDCHFLIVGDGTEYGKLRGWYDSVECSNISLYSRLPKEDYDILVQSCDVGLIFLDRRFTIPNYPSRLLSYMEYKMPIIAATDKNTDVGRIAEENNFGYWCESKNRNDFTNCVNKYVKDKNSIKKMGKNAYYFLLVNYQVDNTYNVIVSHLNK